MSHYQRGGSLLGVDDRHPTILMPRVAYQSIARFAEIALLQPGFGGESNPFKGRPFVHRPSGNTQSASVVWWNTQQNRGRRIRPLPSTEYIQVGRALRRSEGDPCYHLIKAASEFYKPNNNVSL